MNRTIILTLSLITAFLAGCTSPEETGPAQHTETLTIGAGLGLEWKVHLEEGDGFVYDWQASGPLFFDFHGEPDGGAPGEFTSHKLGDAAQDTGRLTAPFSGTHGWYWENQGAEDITLTLVLEGTFEVVGLV